ncbi:MAG: tRNA (adenosine(37)-N6)-dimethylallyltransferase MiaA [bacterium]|nr:tRNA (adenosine(37)-N6)-dimethylallyltransferase MiaA [bacterium]
MAQQKILVIIGPTASGKSDLGVKLAKKLKGEIISADSRQVYKGLDIGTGKITKKEMRGILHHLLDVANPKKQFTVSDYKRLAEEALQYIVKNSKLPIIVGGTGFYIDVLTGAVLIPEVGPDKKFRKRLNKKTTEELFKLLQKKDVKRAKAIGPHNKVRLIRALEIIKTLGKIPKNDYRQPPANFIFIGLKPNNLEKRIYQRLIKRLTGMIREGKKLHEQGLTYKRMHELGLEYRYVGMYLQGKITKKETVDKLYVEIKHYAKRQMTWFKRNKKIRWFTLSAVEGFEPKEYKEIERYLIKILGGR